MTLVFVGLLLIIGIAVVIVVTVAYPHMREGGAVFTPEGQQMVRDAKDRARGWADSAKAKAGWGRPGAAATPGRGAGGSPQVPTPFPTGYTPGDPSRLQYRSPSAGQTPRPRTARSAPGAREDAVRTRGPAAARAVEVQPVADARGADHLDVSVTVDSRIPGQSPRPTSPAARTGRRARPEPGAGSGLLPSAGSSPSLREKSSTAPVGPVGTGAPEPIDLSAAEGLSALGAARSSASDSRRGAGGFLADRAPDGVGAARTADPGREWPEMITSASPCSSPEDSTALPVDAVGTTTPSASSSWDGGTVPRRTAGDSSPHAGPAGREWAEDSCLDFGQANPAPGYIPRTTHLPGGPGAGERGSGDHDWADSVPKDYGSDDYHLSDHDLPSYAPAGDDSDNYGSDDFSPGSHRPEDHSRHDHGLDDYRLDDYDPADHGPGEYVPSARGTTGSGTTGSTADDRTAIGSQRNCEPIKDEAWDAGLGPEEWP